MYDSFADDYADELDESERSERVNSVEKVNGGNEIVQEVPEEAQFPASDGCAENNGGCEHICNAGQDPSTGESTVECSCQQGFALDIDNKRCESEYQPNSH